MTANSACRLAVRCGVPQWFAASAIIPRGTGTFDAARGIMQAYELQISDGSEDWQSPLDWLLFEALRGGSASDN